MAPQNLRGKIIILSIGINQLEIPGLLKLYEI